MLSANWCPYLLHITFKFQFILIYKEGESYRKKNWYLDKLLSLALAFIIYYYITVII